MAKKMSLEERIERLEAVHEIQNLMGRHAYGGASGDKVLEMWAKRTPGTRSNVPSFGCYDGFEGIKRLMAAHEKIEGDRTGQMYMHVLTTPVIEVAGDGKTAKGVWISPGQEVTPAGTGKLTAYWAWLKYGADFVKEDGKWKFWHLNVFGIFLTPVNKSWVEESLPPYTGKIKLPDEVKPDRVTAYWTTYSPTRLQPNVPEPPEPYETWDEATSYVRPEYLK
jgi:hypothetical protein